MPTPCFVANWKMNKGIAEAEAYLLAFEKHAAQYGAAPLSDTDLSGTDRAETIIAPPFTALSYVAEFLKRSALRVDLAAQNVHYEGEGAFTGEISPSMLQDLGCRYVIIGHSERRHLFAETDAVIGRKLDAILKCGLRPILCVGESLAERQRGRTWAVLERQLRKAFAGILHGHDPAENSAEWIIAYEPVWAIGTGQTPTPEDVALVHQKIRSMLSDGLKKGRPRILYGGSVNENNIAVFMKEQPVDGVLVGGASLSADKFHKIIEGGTSAKRG